VSFHSGHEGKFYKRLESHQKHMGLLEFILKKIGIKQKAEEKPEQPPSHYFVDMTTYALEQILSQIPDNYVTINQAGELHGIKSLDIRLILKNTYELAVATRGTPTDYFDLASIESQMAGSMNDEEAATYYASAIAHLKKGARTYPDYQSKLVVNLFKLWNCSHEDNQPVLQEAYREAQKLDSAQNLTPDTLHYIARTFIDMADSDDLSMDAQQRTTLFQRGIKYLQEIANSDGESCDFYALGNAQDKFSYHRTDSQERAELRKNAIENLRKSYESDKDPDTLEYISEIEEDRL